MADLASFPLEQPLVGLETSGAVTFFFAANNFVSFLAGTPLDAKGHKSYRLACHSHRILTSEAVVAVEVHNLYCQKASAGFLNAFVNHKLANVDAQDIGIDFWPMGHPDQGP